MLKGFKDFIARGNAVDLAVAVVIGAAFGAVVTSIVDGIITPLIALLFGQPNFDEALTLTLGSTVFPLGIIVTALVNFILIAAAIYFLVVAPLNTFKKKDEKEEEPAGPTEVELLQSIEKLLKEQATKG